MKLIYSRDTLIDMTRKRVIFLFPLKKKKLALCGIMRSRSRFFERFSTVLLKSRRSRRGKKDVGGSHVSRQLTIEASLHLRIKLREQACSKVIDNEPRFQFRVWLGRRWRQQRSCWATNVTSLMTPRSERKTIDCSEIKTHDYTSSFTSRTIDV